MNPTHVLLGLVVVLLLIVAGLCSASLLLWTDSEALRLLWLASVICYMVGVGYLVRSLLTQ